MRPKTQAVIGVGTLSGSMTLEQQIEFLSRGTTEIINRDDLTKKLASGKNLRIKLGVDPTAADVTLGWAVVLRKLRDFQRLGHTACLVIGDFTAQIGDPSGKSKTRKQLTREEVQSNVEAVSQQVFKILDPDRTEISYNRDWLGTMTFEDVIRLASRTTVARILERDDFSKRLKEERPIALHEILYPLCQGYDSVALRADVELGGNDQMFNNLVGRTLMSQYEMEPQVVVLSPLLIGTDGTEKMSQSLGNYVSIIDTPRDMYGKTMSIPDSLIENWLVLCTDVPIDEIATLVKSCHDGSVNPRDVKRRLAREIVSLYHSAEAAEAEDNYFIETFSKKTQVGDAEEVKIPESCIHDGQIAMHALITTLGLAKSNSEAKSKIQQGGVALDADKVSDLLMPIDQVVGRILRVGKHEFRRLS